MISEALALLAVTGGAVLAFVQSKHQPARVRRVSYWLVSAALCNLSVLALTGFFQKSVDLSSAIHAMTGHLMLPLVALVAGLWLGASMPRMWRRPIRMFPRLVFLLVLCFCCLSNTWTGYLGPSSIDPRIDPDMIVRFRVVHGWVMPLLIGSLLVFWLFRLGAGRAAPANEVSAQYRNTAR